jgi:urate oxidase/2-oxo-4-hydroxy-4-carboxy-5-ureidoimidazoline decarboxylase
MNETRFASGWKRNYYGKGDVGAYRLNRADNTMFAVNVTLLLYGDAFWPTYTTGDNSDLVATDSMKNFIQRETSNFSGAGLEEYGRFLGQKFLAIYPHTDGLQITVSEVPYCSAGSKALTPAGPERAFARLEMRTGALVEARSGIDGFRLLRLGGSAFHGFIRDEYTTLPDLKDRPLHMWLDLSWSYLEPEAAFNEGAATAAVRRIVGKVFDEFESGSIQEVIYQMGTRLLEEIPTIGQVDLEANNRTWDPVAEGVYTDARPPYGILGLSLRR